MRPGSPGPTAAAEPRRLGRSGVEVSRLGLGTAPLGGLYRPVADEEAAACLDAALAAGIRYLDTAPLYGLGLAEKRLGEALRDRERSSVTISTKIGRMVVGDPAGPPGRRGGARAEYAFSRDAVLASFEASLERLGTDRVDVLLLHDPSDHLEAARGGAIPVLQELRAEGTVGAIGVGTDDSAVSARLVAEAGLDCALVAGRLSLLDQSALDELAPACVEHGASLIAAGIYGSGILADPAGTPMYDYEPASDAVRRRVDELERACAAHDVALPTAAIQYPLAHPAVACVLVGARSAEEVEENATRFGSPVPAALWDELEERGLVRPRR